MRNRILLLALAIVSAMGFNQAFAGSGGPDTYGYVWKDSNEPGGPAYVWNSIVGAPGAQQVSGLTDDNSVAFINFGWNFHYYWTDHNQFKLGSNGWVGFNNIGNIASCFPLIPTQGGSGDNYLGVFMSDLIYTSNSPGSPNPAEVWWWSNNTDTLIIEWSQVPWWTNGSPDWIGSNTFQLILSGVDSSITFMYNDTDPANWTDNGGCNADMEIGIENITGNIGLEVYNEALPPDNFAVKFYYPATVTFQVPDATPKWNANADNAGQFYIAGSNATAQDMVANIANVGNAAITSNITAAGDIRLPGSSSAFWTSSTSLSTGLAAGDDSTVTFPTQVTFTVPNQHYAYKVTTTTAGGQDINPSNNINTVEVVAAPCVGDTMNLTYSSATQPDGGISWAGGANDEGAGVFIMPPAYPATINNVDVWIVDPAGAPTPGQHSPFDIKIYGDNGMPGTLLDSVNVAANAATEGVWYRVRMSGTSTINSGGWYVAWFQGGGDVILGTETQSPISRRTYEILSGAWSPYRDITVNDFMISANISVTCPQGSGVKDDQNTALQLKAVPNPSTGVTSIRYELPTIGDVKVTVVNMFGQTVFSQSEIGAAAGHHRMNFDGSDLANGLYIVNLETVSGKMSSRLVINR
ncbi:MAG: T9SS type A sorting domain-containing protein [Bacteroidia bacterium]